MTQPSEHIVCRKVECAFLLSGGIQKTQSHFYVVAVGKPTVFRGRASFSGGAVKRGLSYRDQVIDLEPLKFLAFTELYEAL